MYFCLYLCLVATTSFFGPFVMGVPTTTEPNKQSNFNNIIKNLISSLLDKSKGNSQLFTPQLPASSMGILNSIPGQAGLQQLMAGQNNSALYKTLQQFLPALPLVFEKGLKEKNISTRCSVDISTFLNAMTAGEQWALKMFDSSGKLPRGLFEGNLNFMGQYDECRKTVSGSTGSSSTSGHVVRGTTCIAHFKLPPGIPLGSLPIVDLSGAFQIKWHMCVPDSCGQDDIVSLFQGSLPMNLSIFAFCREQQQPDFSTDIGAIVSVVILCILLACVVLGSLLDVSRGCLTKTKTYELNCTTETSSQNRSDAVIATSVNEGKDNPMFESDKLAIDNDKMEVNGIKLNDITKTKPQVVTPNESPPKDTGFVRYGDDPVWQQLLLSFSAFSNSEKILSTKPSKGSIGCVHGIRVISMSWVILGHTFLVLYPYSENPLRMTEFIKSFPFQLILNAGVSVDTFFLISGILTAYLFLRETRKSRRVTCKQMALYYFHRFWRLTPALMMWVMISTALLRYVGDGPEWNGPIDMKQCKNMGWLYTMLYIINFFPQKDHCFGISWFLANDMQFYIVAPLVLVPLTYGFKKLGLGVVTAFVITHITSTAILVNKYNAGIIVNGTEYFSNIYIRPYARIAPYAIGLALGYALQRLDCKARINRVIQLLCWFVSVGVALTIMYITYIENGGHHFWSGGERAAFETCCRVGWSLAVSWVIFVCATGNGGYVNSVLCWDGWLPMSRLTYGAFLIHISVMTYDVGTRRVAGYFSVYNVIMKFFGYCTMTFIFAFANSLVIESPLLGIEKVLLKKR